MAQLLRKSWKLYSQLERILICVTTALIFILLVIFIHMLSNREQKENRCSTSNCIIEAAKIAHQINSDIQPCDDFYQFACGNHLKFGEEDKKSEHPLEPLHSQMEQEIYELCAEPLHEDDHYMVNSEKKLFQACMSRREKGQDNINTIKNAVKALGGWPIIEGDNWDEAKFDWLETMYKLRELGYPYGIFLDLDVSVDPLNSTGYILEVVVPYYTATTASSLNESMITDVRRFGANLQMVSAQIEEMHEFEGKLRSAPRNSTDTVFTVSQFQRKFGMINWLEFINRLSGPAAQITKTQNVLFPDQEVLRNRLEIIASVPKRTLANYMMWRVVAQTVPYLRVRPSLVERACMRMIEDRYIPNPIYVMYARKYLSRPITEEITQLVFNIRDEFVILIDSLKWLEKEEKKGLEEKIKKMTIVIGLHGDYFNDTVLDDINFDMMNVTDDNFVNLLAQANRNYNSHKYSKIYKTESEYLLNYHRDWLPDPHLISYSQQSNILRISTILLQSTVFSKNRPKYFNYGVLGITVGNYISSMIIDHSNKSNTNFNEWPKQISNEFNDYSKCISTEMENLGIFQDEIMSEAIPKYVIASKAVYKSWLKNENDPKLIGFDYTPEQLFWIATVSCTPGHPYDRIAINFHGKTYSNVLKTYMRNIPEFAIDFNCPVKSLMNPTEKCLLV